MATVTFEGICCPDCAGVIANDEWSGITDPEGHRVRMKERNADRGYLVVTDPVAAEQGTECDTCGQEIDTYKLTYDGMNAWGVAALH